MKAIFVIGMGRSGTSVLTRLLEIAGAYVGSERTLMPANEWNETGYWEDMRFVNINARILEAFDGSWCDPPMLPPGWLDDQRLQPFFAEAQSLLQEHFQMHPLWAVKDPRVALLLPFWHRLVERPRHVMCVRNPLDVAASLAKRDGTPQDLSIALWHVYTLYALLGTQPEDRQVLLYEPLICDPLTEVAPLFSFLGVPERLKDPQVRQTIGQSVQAGLSHHEHTVQDLLDDPHILASTKRLYAALVDTDQKALQAALDDSEETLRALHCITRACGRMFLACADVLNGKRSRKARRPASARPKHPLLSMINGWR